MGGRQSLNTSWDSLPDEAHTIIGAAIDGIRSAIIEQKPQVRGLRGRLDENSALDHDGMVSGCIDLRSVTRPSHC